MKVGENEIKVAPLDPKRTVKLVQFFGEVWEVIDEAEQKSLTAGVVQGRWMLFTKVLQPEHLTKLTSILTGVPQKEIDGVWTLGMFTEVLAELSEVEDLTALVKNLQRVAAAYQS